MNWPSELIKEAKEIIEKIYKSDTNPARDKILFFTNFNPQDIKIIILGQDPYPTPGIANGRAFAVNKENKIPHSLRNIFREIKEIKGYVSADRTLKHWENQGVLLINTSLTVTHFKPNSHKNQWKPFMDKLIKWLDDNFELTWVLWGNEAKKYSKSLKNFVIEDAHPSPLSFKYRKKITFKKLDKIDW
ncbi:MAG: uracil-DNA glycosylase [Mycoplasmatales bacterium]|nr:uracil-DNA glycosylase [Mycoplasmatales bacterium]